MVLFSLKLFTANRLEQTLSIATVFNCIISAIVAHYRMSLEGHEWGIIIWRLMTVG